MINWNQKTMFANRLSSVFIKYIISADTFTNSAISASYPDFTGIVEQNMPAVVIVNATRSISNANKENQFKTPPGMPDEFNDLFKKFFDETKEVLREEHLVLVPVLSYRQMDIL